MASSNATSQPSKWGLREWETAECDTVHIFKLLSPCVAFPTSVCCPLDCLSNDGQTDITAL